MEEEIEYSEFTEALLEHNEQIWKEIRETNIQTIQTNQNEHTRQHETS